MENPTFFLEGVVRTQDEMEDFEGPLTLILALLAKNKIEIQDIEISKLLDQYLAYLDEMKAMDLEIASEFVSMASHLVYIKARMLLSAGDADPELEELMESLERLKNKDLYESIRDLTPVLGSMYTRGAGTIVKPPEYLEPQREYRYTHDAGDLYEAMMSVLSREGLPGGVIEAGAFRMPERIVYSVTEKTRELLTYLRESGPVELGEIYRMSESRTELVATFIALLELCRAGRLIIDGDGPEARVSCFEGEPDGLT